jgi:DNA-binding XRE family transcriptional regulator
METLRIFKGKQKDYNIAVLTLLFDNGPLTAWELTAKMTKTGRQSLHATLNKRLRALEAKSYVRREDKKWILRFKGFIAVLLIQKEPKMWNPVWKEIFDSKAKIIEETPEPLLKRYGMAKEKIRAMRKRIGISLDNFDAWVELSKKAKSLIENGMLDFDIIKEETLFALLVMETMTAEELADYFWKPETEPN